MASGEWGVKDTTALIPVIQNVWAPYLTMRHVLLESFVWEEANRVPFLIREFSAIFWNFRRIFGFLGEFSAKKEKKITIFQYRRYSILAVRYSIL